MFHKKSRQKTIASHNGLEAILEQVQAGEWKP